MDKENKEPSPGKKRPAPGKKPRGRVKIPMEYIHNKQQRLTTFSKNISARKHEFSALTGTEVYMWEVHMAYFSLAIPFHLFLASFED